MFRLNINKCHSCQTAGNSNFTLFGSRTQCGTVVLVSFLLAETRENRAVVVFVVLDNFQEA
jgi:hypothetical protein